MGGEVDLSFTAFWTPKTLMILFPLWYPALVFALAGVGVLRFHRHFSVRSALITISVVAALLGMIVAL
jgi:hypothetical protein